MARFSERLRQLRTARDLSQMEFSKQIGISKSSVNMYERGEREPGLETLEQIADYFNVDLDYLLGKSDVVCKAHFQFPIAESQQSSSVGLRALPDSFLLSSDEQDMIHKFRCLDDRGKSAVLNVLNHEYESLPGEKTNPASKEA